MVRYQLVLSALVISTACAPPTGGPNNPGPLLCEVEADCLGAQTRVLGTGECRDLQAGDAVATTPTCVPASSTRIARKDTAAAAPPVRTRERWRWWSRRRADARHRRRYPGWGRMRSHQRLPDRPVLFAGRARLR